MSEERKDLTNGVWNQLIPRLREYLVYQGVTINDQQFFSCIAPDHPDHNPSCSIGGNISPPESVFHCFSCGKSGNIFHACHFLEKKPISGPGFFEDTLVHLSKMFEIEYEPVKISDDVKREYQKRRAYQDAVNIVHNNMFKGGKLRTDHIAIKHLIERGIDESAIKKFKIGCIDSHKEYLDDMKSIGWTDREWLSSADLANKGIFNKDGIIIPIFDDKHRPAGFVTRTTLDITKESVPKFINSLNSDIYHKSEILFNFNNYAKEDGPLYIVEGYLDSVYLTQMGLKNVVAIGATALTDQHVDMLARNSVKNVFLVLDGDEGGYKGTALAIERLAPYKSFNTRIVELPEGKDPDTYIREHGVESYLALCREALSPFAWTLKHTSFQDDPDVIAQRAIPCIAIEDSAITRNRMIKELVKITGVSGDDIKKDVELARNKEAEGYIDEVAEVNKVVQIQLNKRKVRDTKSILEDALYKLKGIEKLYNNNVDTRSEYSQRIEEIKSKITSEQFIKGLIAPGFPKLCDQLDGIPYWTNLSILGGRPSSGKTMYLIALAIDIIDANPDAAIFFMSIDDTTDLMTLKMLAMKSGLSTSTIKKYTTLEREDKEKIDKAWHWLEANSDRLIIADAKMGNSVDAMESHVDWFMRECQDKKRLFFLDNFHKLRMGSRNGKKTEAVADTSEKIKEITALNDLHVVMTVELRKLEGSDSRPTLGDLKDSVQMEYDADVILLMHNDYQVKKEKTNIVWKNNDFGGRTMPYLEVYLEKNKVTGLTDRMAHKLNTINLRITEADWGVIEKFRATKTSHATINLGREKAM